MYKEQAYFNIIPLVAKKRKPFLMNPYLQFNLPIPDMEEFYRKDWDTKMPGFLY